MAFRINGRAKIAKHHIANEMLTKAFELVFKGAYVLSRDMDQQSPVVSA